VAKAAITATRVARALARTTADVSMSSVAIRSVHPVVRVVIELDQVVGRVSEHEGEMLEHMTRFTH
jgi:hypothetical protein